MVENKQMSMMEKLSRIFAGELGQKIIKGLKKGFSSDKEITKALKNSPNATAKQLAKGTFNNKNTKTKANKIIKEVMTKSKKPTSTATPFTIKPSKKTPDVSITIASIGIPKSRPEKPKSKKPENKTTPFTIKPKSKSQKLEKKKTPTKKTQTLVHLKSGKKGTIAQRLAELDKEKALEKVKKLAQTSLAKKKVKRLAQASLKKKKTRKA